MALYKSVYYYYYSTGTWTSQPRMHLRLPSWTENWCHTNVTINTKPATHSKMWPIVTDVLWFVWVCWSVSRPWVVLKWLNQSRRRLSAQETIHSVGPGSPEELVILGISPGPLWMSWVRLPRTFHFSGNNLGQVVHTHVPLPPSSTIWQRSKCWEGNRRSGVTLAMHHRLQWFIHPWAHGLDREMSTLQYGVWLVYLTFTFSP